MWITLACTFQKVWRQKWVVLRSSKELRRKGGGEGGRVMRLVVLK